ncbi:MAG: flavin reductase [Bacteroidales bacterium]|jgi:flavin reductase (DIM6/NTAB) family NADH-FMN oxidoreductase RutF|nr:flavin reductase [Bacteroidales bacterium]
MKKIIWFIFIIFLISCGGNKKSENVVENIEVKEIDMDVKDKNFDELFKKLEAKDFNENVFTLFQNASVLTSGTESDFNSMTIGWGGWGQYFGEPASWCFLRANRYTLEYIKETKTYTMAFFDNYYHEHVMHFGKTSGRDTDKMGTHELHSVLTPLKNVSYKEASVIVECELMEISTVKPDDFYFEAGREFIMGGFEEAGDYHKMIFGKITNIWVRK